MSESKLENEISTILVTGGTGLVGKGIETVLDSYNLKLDNENWIFLSSKDGNLIDRDETNAIFERYRPDYVIHLAAAVGGLFKNMREKVDMYRNNILINDNIMDCCHRFHVKKLVSCLSTCIFPDKTEYPINEEMVHNGPPHPSNEGYAYAKRMIDVANRCYYEQHGDLFTSIIPTNVYGPYDNYDIQDGHVIPGLIHKCFLSMQEKNEEIENNSVGNPFIVWGTGSPLRQFIYSEDLARLIIWTLRNYNEITPIILSVDPEDEVSIYDVASLVAEKMEYGKEPDQDTTKADGQFKKTASNAKLRRLLQEEGNNFQFTPISEGIEKTCQWFRKNYKNARGHLDPENFANANDIFS